MKIVIPGGTGQLGTLLARTFHQDGHDVAVIGRSVGRFPWRSVVWDPTSDGAWTEEFDGADIVINLAGRSVNCRYTPEHRREILESRTVSVQAVGRAIRKASNPPSLWLQSSTATIYAHRYDDANDETTGIIGGSEKDVPDTWKFSIDVANAWERALDEAPTPRTRKVKLRTAMVMSPDAGGVFDTLMGLVRVGLGGSAGSGRQYVSWIHDTDFVRALHWIIDHPDIEGIVNLASPNPLPNRQFMADLRRIHGMPIGLPATGWMPEVGAVLLRTETELLLKSRRVVPGFLLQQGFSFNHPTWSGAAEDLHRRWRNDDNR